jgi:hypothetical protein
MLGDIVLENLEEDKDDLLKDNYKSALRLMILSLMYLLYVLYVL